MRTLDNLIRLGRWRLDEQRRVVTDLDRLKDGLLAELARLAIDMEREAMLSQGDSEFAVAYPAWLRLALGRRDRLNASLAEADAKLVVAQDDLRECFQELKRYETLAEGRTKRERAAVERRQNAELDEIGLARFRRAAGQGA